METIWIEDKQLAKALERNEAFWDGGLEESPLMWVTASDAKPGVSPVEPADDQKIWTDVDYVMSAAEDKLSRMHYAGDALPVFNPWLGPDQFAAWLGADITLKPKDFTSWVKPFVEDWRQHPEFKIDPDNKWWKLYLKTVRCSVEAGRGKWITAYPDLHSGIDGLSAIRGPENLMMDMMTEPDAVKQAMGQMTELFKYVVDVVSDIVLPAGQGTSNWTMGWSEKRFLCIGQNDFSCMISPGMFVDFCWDDTVGTCNYSDRSLYHLDGPDAVRHLPKILEIESLDAVQWIQGAGNPLPSTRVDMLRQIQQAGKSVQLFYGGAHGGDADMFEEIKILCEALDPTKLFIWADVDSAEKADALVEYSKAVCRKK